MSDEIWKDINVQGYEGLYQVSNIGRVMSKGRYVSHHNSATGKAFKKATLLKPKTDKDGYLEVQLWKNNKGKTCKVHRLVASEFLVARKDQSCVNHLNKDRADNREENLEWCTVTENIRHSSKLNWSLVHRIRHLSEDQGLCNAEIARRQNVSSTTVDKIVNKETWA